MPITCAMCATHSRLFFSLFTVCFFVAFVHFSVVIPSRCIIRDVDMRAFLFTLSCCRRYFVSFRLLVDSVGLHFIVIKFFVRNIGIYRYMSKWFLSIHSFIEPMVAFSLLSFQFQFYSFFLFYFALAFVAHSFHFHYSSIYERISFLMWFVVSVYTILVCVGVHIFLSSTLLYSRSFHVPRTKRNRFLSACLSKRLFMLRIGCLPSFSFLYSFSLCVCCFFREARAWFYYFGSSKVNMKHTQTLECCPGTNGREYLKNIYIVSI